MRMMRRGPWMVAFAALALVTGCTTLPVSGDVHTQPDSSVSPADQAPYFVPPGPVAGADPAAIVRGFLLATQANPASTSVARSFLTDRASAAWKPTGTIVYDASTLQNNASGVLAHLTAAHRLDERGGWVGGTTASSVNMQFDVVQENGEWRIDNPPAALPVPSSYFASVFVPFLLYFYDHSGTVLVPTRVYLPLGEQVASSLVRGLLSGPSGAGSGSQVSAFGSGTGLDLSVVVSADGVAEIPLSANIQRLAPPDLYRAVLQLAETLKQVPGLVRIRVTVDGIALPLINGQTDVNVDVASDHDPITAPATDPVAVIGGRVVRISGTGSHALAGPLGVPGFALRSVAQSVASHELAGVASNGRRAYLAPDAGAAQPARVATVLNGAEDLLRPAFDRFGGLWLVDRTKSGAVVHLLTGTRDRIVDVPGVSGRRIAAFTLTRDGASFVAGLSAGPNQVIAVSTLDRGANGALIGASSARRLEVSGADLGPIVDLGQDSATTVAVLTQASAGSGRLVSVELDGSPARVPSPLDPVPGQLRTLLAGADPRLPLHVVTNDGLLLTLTGAGDWARSAAGVLGAAYPQ